MPDIVRNECHGASPGKRAPRVAPYASVAEVYDRLIGDAGFEPIWHAFRRSCQQHGIGFDSVADVGCGTGRFLARLARDPRLRLLGVDRSPAMLTVARRRLAGSAVVLQHQDMRRLQLPEAVDLITVNFNCLNYLTTADDLQATVKRFAANLRCDGHLIGDIVLPKEKGRDLSAVRQIIRMPGIRAVWDIRPSVRREGTAVRMLSCLRRPGGVWACAREEHVQRWWPWATMRTTLERVGFAVAGLHRLPDHGRPRPGDQWVQIVARRCGYG